MNVVKNKFINLLEIVVKKLNCDVATEQIVLKQKVELNDRDTFAS